jgi:signal transduction histidine kinase
MNLPEMINSFDQILVFVYFVYGLSFFGMGLTLALESERSPALAEARLLRPLAAFGMIHGVHEWLESDLLQSQIGGLAWPDWLPWFRIGMLFISLVPLLVYGILSLRQYPLQPHWHYYLTASLLGIFCTGILASAIITYHSGPIPWSAILDSLIRYLLAVPGALLTALALRAQALRLWTGDRRRLKFFLSLASMGFIVYGISQIFVPKIEMLPARIINATLFLHLAGFPIQIVRTLAAITVTVGMLRATQVVEKQRQLQLHEIQRDRLDALERVHTEMERRESMRRELLRHIVQAQEEERARIARELHDETAQTLAAFALDTATLQASVPDKPEIKMLTTRLQMLGKQMSQGLYRLVHDLRPAQLDDLGLVPAIQFLVDQDARSKQLNVHLDVKGTIRRLDAVVETVLFRVTQEALTNVIRHAQTKQAVVTLQYLTQQISLTISDQGVGFDPAQSFSPPRGWGLAGMRERVEAVGGQLMIHSSLGRGTTVEVIVQVFDLIP